MAVGRFQNHTVNDPAAFGEPCCITADARPTVRHRQCMSLPLLGLRRCRRTVWVLKDPNPIPIGFMGQYTEMVMKTQDEKNDLSPFGVFAAPTKQSPGR